MIDHWCQIVLSYGTMDVARTHLESFWPVTFVVSYDYPLVSGRHFSSYFSSSWHSLSTYSRWMVSESQLPFTKCRNHPLQVPQRCAASCLPRERWSLFVPIALKICLNFLVILRIDPDPDLFLTLSLFSTKIAIEQNWLYDPKPCTKMQICMEYQYIRLCTPTLAYDDALPWWPAPIQMNSRALEQRENHPINRTRMWRP